MITEWTASGYRVKIDTSIIGSIILTCETRYVELAKDSAWVLSTLSFVFPNLTQPMEPTIKHWLSFYDGNLIDMVLPEFRSCLSNMMANTLSQPRPADPNTN